MPSPQPQPGSHINSPRRWLQEAYDAGERVMRGGVAAIRDANVPAIGRPVLVSSSLGLLSAPALGRRRNHETRDLNQSTGSLGISALVQQTGDPELAHQRMLELFRRIRVLSDDNRFRHLNEAASANRTAFLSWYRAREFLVDLAEGHHDGFTAALENQEHDSYYSDLWNRVIRRSRGAARALADRIQPHEPPRIALTIPPRYEPSDLPQYTATVLPPPYTASVPDGHVAKDIPLCIAHDCPLRLLGIEHCLGTYHHHGQVGPTIQSGGSWLPSFGVSNPPPFIWDAYNHMVLDVDTDYQTRVVKTFIRYHGRPWTPEEEEQNPPLPSNTNTPKAERNSCNKDLPKDGLENRKIGLPAGERLGQDRYRRIPQYSYDIPDVPNSNSTTTDFETHGLEGTTTTITRDFGAEIIAAATLNARPTNAEAAEGPLEPHPSRSPPQHPNVDEGTRIHDPRSLSSRTQTSFSAHMGRLLEGHRRGNVRVQRPRIQEGGVYLPGIAEVVEQEGRNNG
ncbi:MAG: hypothetical protein Q9186_006348 [Xanthomendoza sp. 1 TL-2023]